MPARLAAALLLLPLPATAAAQRATVGTMDWESLPPLQRHNGPFNGTPAREELQRIIRNGICELPGATVRRFNITVRYAALISPAGEIVEIRVEPTGCRPLESLVAGMVIGTAGSILPPGGETLQWMRGRIRFDN